MSNSERIEFKSIPERLYLATAYIDRANSLLEEFSENLSHTYAPWSVAEHCKRRVQELGVDMLNPNPGRHDNWDKIVIPDGPIKELDEYCARVVLPTALSSVTASHVLSDPIDSVLLSVALQNRIPHNEIANQASGWYMAQHIVRDAEIDTPKSIYSASQLVKAIEPALSAWFLLDKVEDRFSLLLATAIIKNKLSGRGIEWLEKFAAEVSKKFDRIENSGWTFLVHRSIAEALHLLAHNPKGKKLLEDAKKILDPKLLVSSKGRGLVKLEYALEQAFTIRKSVNRNIVRDAIESADK